MPVNSKILELSKNSYVCCKHTYKNTRTKFQSIIFIFGHAMVKKKTDQCADITFWKCNFMAFVIVVRKNK